jgi:hypothetical protein
MRGIICIEKFKKADNEKIYFLFRDNRKSMKNKENIFTIFTYSTLQKLESSIGHYFAHKMFFISERNSTFHDHHDHHHCLPQKLLPAKVIRILLLSIS